MDIYNKIRKILRSFNWAPYFNYIMWDSEIILFRDNNLMEVCITYNDKRKICIATQTIDSSFPYEKEMVDIDCLYEVLSIVSNKTSPFGKCFNILLKSKLI